jgi:hypothetical protein
MTVTPDDIVDYARTWIGATWRHQGRGTGDDRGIDCAGLLLVTAAHFGLQHADMPGYRRQPGREFADHIKNHTDAFDYPIHGAIGIFNDSNQPCHTGIFAVHPVTGRVSVIHSEASPSRCCHEEGYDDRTPSLKDRLVAVRLYKGVNYVI